MEIKSQNFRTGPTMLTQGVNSFISQIANFQLFINQCLTKHKSCDWGDCCENDWKNNDASIEIGERILSTYNLPSDFQKLTNETKIWIITERDRSATTVLFPSEY
jgi:hypothetical protein